MSMTHTRLTPVSVGKLSPKAPYSFDLQPRDDDLLGLQDDLGLIGLRKLRLKGEITADGATDWTLYARLGATVVQPCVATLEPVTTRIDEDVTRRFLKNWPDEADLGEETEMPEDDSLERLRDEIDLFAVLRESLSLSLPTYPRADGATADIAEARPDGAAPITSIGDDAVSALSDLKKKLEKDGK
ncbi:MAG: DUF177 domain-containing protein [Pseudomonadota bacterium]